MATRSQIVAEARTWIGTPWHHQGRLKGPSGGVDCVGLLVGTARACGLALDDVTDYPRRPQGDRLITELRARLDEIPVADAQPGDALAYWHAAVGIAQHIGLKTDRGMVHSFLEGGRGVRNRDPGRVIETSIDEVWTPRLVAAFRLRGLED